MLGRFQCIPDSSALTTLSMHSRQQCSHLCAPSTNSSRRKTLLAPSKLIPILTLTAGLCRSGDCGSLEDFLDLCQFGVSHPQLPGHISLLLLEFFLLNAVKRTLIPFSYASGIKLNNSYSVRYSRSVRYQTVGRGRQFLSLFVSFWQYQNVPCINPHP